MRRHLLALALLGSVACGGPPPAAHAPPVPDEAKAGFGPYTVSAGRAVAAALMGSAVPAHFTCGGAADLRATAAEEKAKLAPLGAMVDIVTVGFKVSLSARGREGLAPEEAQDVATGKLTAFVHARSLVGPNGKLTWVDANGYLAGMEVPAENRAEIARLVRPVATGLEETLGGLASEACVLHLMTAEDLDALPYPLQKDERDVLLSQMKTMARQLPRACRAARSGRPPWEVHFHHLDVVLRGNGMLARARARARIEGDGICLSPAEVLQVVSGG